MQEQQNQRLRSGARQGHKQTNFSGRRRGETDNALKVLLFGAFQNWYYGYGLPTKGGS